ncbi:hypothetical protein BaRGS_00038395, partial [Batillaria attramentaria]
RKSLWTQNLRVSSGNISASPRGLLQPAWCDRVSYWAAALVGRVSVSGGVGRPGVDAAVTIFPGLVTSTSTFWLLTAAAAGLPTPPATPSVSPTQRCLPVPQPVTPRWVKKAM